MKLFDNLYFNGKRDSKNIGLSFDDGPSEETERVLDILKKYDAKATFFVCGKNIEGRENVIKRIMKEGHEIGNHTYSHPSLLIRNKKYSMNEIVKTDIELKKIKIKTNLFRAPYFRLGIGAFLACKKLNKKVIFGNLFWDWRLNLENDKIINRISKKSKNGSIIILHDHLENIGKHKRITDLTERTCKMLRERKFGIVKISDII